MNKNKILAVLAIPALLAACSQDEFTENAISQKVDLSNRKVLENVVLNFGDADAQTRGTIGTTSYNSYKWTSEDGVGACIIDAPNSNGGYDVTDDYISSNYKYYYTAESQWKTDALMVEGNYMFYSPYNENHLVRSNIVATVPATQNVLTKTDDNNPIKEFYESGEPVFVGYKFLSAKDQQKVIDVKMRHIFAYPLFTLTNLYDTRADKSKGEPTYQDIKITKVVLSRPGTGRFTVKYGTNNGNVANKMAPDAAGNPQWDATKHEGNTTTDLFNEIKTDASGNDITVRSIVINMGEGITLKGEESLSFHAVLPAMAYQNGINVTAYDADGNSYSPRAKTASTGLTLNPGYRYPAQEYNTDGELKASKGQLMTYKLEAKNAAPTDILNNEDFVAYLKSLSVRYNDLSQVPADKENRGENEFVLNDDAEIMINSEMIDALVNYNYSATTTGSVTFTAKNIYIAPDVTVATADFSNNVVTMEVVSAAGKEYIIKMPAKETMDKDGGTYVLSTAGNLSIDNQQKAPTNIIIKENNISFDGVNAKKITSLNVVEDAILTLTGTTENVTINNAGTLSINADKLVTSKIVNTGTVNNSGIMFAENNVNNGTIEVKEVTAVTKVAVGTGKIVNSNLGAVKANADQTVTWTGNWSKIIGDDGLAKKGDAKYGVNTVKLEDQKLTSDVTLALLKAPIKGCTVTTIQLLNADELVIAEGGDMSGLTLVFDKEATWKGDAFNNPQFTSANIRVKDNVNVTVTYASVSGKQDKSEEGYKTGKIVAGDAGKINF